MAAPTQERKTLQLSREMVFKGKALRAAQGAPYAEGVKICVERPRLLTESYKQTEGDPMVMRRAKALAHILDNMTIFIKPWEIIVGNFASGPDAIQYYPELFTRWVDHAIDNDYKAMVDDEERKELHEIHKYWRNKSVHGQERVLVPEEVKPYLTGMNHGAFFWLHGSRTGVPNFDEVFRLGLAGIVKKAEDRLKELSTDPQQYINGKEYIRRKRFLEAAIISLNAGIRWGKRYASLAGDMAESEKDAARKAELEKIAQVCEWVPENPPRSLHEALQSYFFITLITRVIDLQTSGLGDRFDQIMFPVYRKENEAGKITREEAQTLIEYLFLKMNEFGEMVPPIMGSGTGGGFVVTTRLFTIGGVTAGGEDATNEMTSIALAARAALPLTQPTVAIRVHKNTPEDFLLEMTDAIRSQPGVFSIFNDEMMIPFITSLGVGLEDARNYSKEGCMRWVIPGKPMAQRALGGMFSLPKLLEYTLNRGIKKSDGKQIGAPTKDPLDFKSVDDMIEAYLEQVRFFVEKCVVINNIVETVDNEFLPQPFLSALMDGCIERGEDCRTYKYIPNSILQPVGQITVVNSIAAMKKLVFEDKKVTMAELIEALDKNWEGGEKLRLMFQNAPKFGMDDDYADSIAQMLYGRTSEIIRSFKDIYGGFFREDGTGGSTYFAGSLLTGATPDGRRAFELFNDGTISPTPGTDMQGPTAVLKSISKIDHINGFTNCLNQKFPPQFLEGENRKKFVSYLKGFIALGLHHIQFNIFGRETLVKAQENPQEYSSMVVRVAGYSAYFTDLNKNLQDQIIARTQHETI